ncbi:uncharacterized protein RCO7_07853 [Rhynchosporium graminicola]|uniref:Uncharacterized protein n=1 Tax=Rhynchosporium graminicola TaxID=2792576 RepID=A0A1E1K909_9HELO|nr:uncharacterized protein RCO7_07853 [Rhynchosporium commune]
MFKEVVSLAIILGFIWNIIYVEHPDTRSYTIVFVGSLGALAPFVLGWHCWNEVKKGVPLREILRWRYWMHSKSRIPDHEEENDSEIRNGLVSGDRNGGAEILNERHFRISAFQYCPKSQVMRVYFDHTCEVITVKVTTL